MSSSVRHSVWASPLPQATSMTLWPCSASTWILHTDVHLSFISLQLCEKTYWGEINNENCFDSCVNLRWELFAQTISVFEQTVSIPCVYFWDLCEIGSALTNQFGLKLILAISMTQPSIATLAPREELSTGSNAGTVGPPGCNVHYFHSPEWLDNTRTVTGTEDKTSYTYYKITLRAKLFLTVS